MIEPPQFRTVLRGADPEQVAEAIKELHTSLVVARRAAADRTIELSRTQEEHQETQAELEADRRRIAELEQGSRSGGAGYDDLGGRIGSIFSLAQEEAAQMRGAAEAEIEQRRDQATRDLRAELAPEEARLDALRLRVAQLTSELDEARGANEVENERRRAEATLEAEQIRRQAGEDAQRIRSEAEQQSAAAIAHRDQVHAHLGEVSRLIADAVGSHGSESASSTRTAELEPAPHPEEPGHAAPGGDHAEDDGNGTPSSDATQVMESLRH